MKRYRILSYDFDTRANILSQEISDSWEAKIREQWKKNKNQIKEGLLSQYGVSESLRKIDDFVEFGWLPISITAFHNKFLRQVRDAYVYGSYYPALTGACALGERILNQLILHLRDDYSGTSEYRKVYRKDSFDNWDLAINTLETWGVLLPDVAVSFRDMKELRNRALHFNPETDHHDKQLALAACNKLKEIIEGQFAGFGAHPWFIQNNRGLNFIKKEAEEWPFVKRIILPNCVLVGPYHTLEAGRQGWVVHDRHSYEEREISDEEFIALLEPRAS